MNHFTTYSDRMIVEGVMESEEAGLIWLGGLDRAEQLEVMQAVARVLASGRLRQIGPKGAFELVWKTMKATTDEHRFTQIYKFQ